MPERFPQAPTPDSVQKPTEKEPNFHEVAKERSALRRALDDLGVDAADPKSIETLSGSRRTVAEGYAKRLAEVNEQAKEFNIEELGGLSEAKKELRGQKESADDVAWIDEPKISREIGPAYAELKRIDDDLADLGDFELRRMREVKTDPYAKKAHERLLQTVAAEKASLAAKEETEKIAHPIEARAFDLVRYKKGLHEAGHIAPVPSVERYLHEISSRMVSGKPMFLHGPTGTGKTSLARFAAEHITKKQPEMIYCNPQTREANIHGRTGLKPAGKENASLETYFDWGPLAKAMRDGSTVIFDEFTALPKEQMSMLKGIMSAKVGDQVPITGNGNIEIMPGFQMIFTANLKSEKNPERQDIPPEMANEFDQNNLEVSYTPKEEAYDIMLARLMNPDGSVDLSYHDLNITLPKFCEALGEIQLAYTGTTSEDTARLTQTMAAGGKRPGLKKLVMNQRTVEAVLDGWQTEKINKNHKPFSQFLDERLKMSLTFREYSESDRILAAKILASKGFLQTLSAEELGLPGNVFDFDAAKKMRADNEAREKLIAASKDEKHITLKEVAALDPFGMRKKAVEAAAAEFVGPEEAEDTGEKGKGRGKGGRKNPADAIIQATQEEMAELAKAENEPFLNKTFEMWYNKNDAKKAKYEPHMADPSSQDYGALKDDTVAAKAGEYTLNPEMHGFNDSAYEQMAAEGKIKIEDLSQFNGKLLAEVAEHVMKKYSADHYIPDIEFWKWAIEHPDKVPQELKDGNWYFMFGSILRDGDGDWSVPIVYWDGDEFDRDASWLSNVWSSDGRVVLLEK